MSAAGISATVLATQLLAALKADLADRVDTESMLRAETVGPNTSRFLREVAAILAAETQRATDAAAEAEASKRRYNIVRALNVPQFQELLVRHARENVRFDDLVDEMTKRKR